MTPNWWNFDHHIIYLELWGNLGALKSVSCFFVNCASTQKFTHAPDVRQEIRWQNAMQGWNTSTNRSNRSGRRFRVVDDESTRGSSHFPSYPHGHWSMNRPTNDSGMIRLIRSQRFHPWPKRPRLDHPLAGFIRLVHGFWWSWFSWDPQKSIILSHSCAKWWGSHGKLAIGIFGRHYEQPIGIRLESSHFWWFLMGISMNLTRTGGQLWGKTPTNMVIRFDISGI